uniref:carboxypeptidase-like regulatory domain-containing protein n=1 Tax=uncultured Tenacibaculum sp. TaxID=174713 RepID=UPI00262497D8|nr:carboxypeptidase-like regulatory domain-containing protein [uncultured Tenacibaculum sp.]
MKKLFFFLVLISSLTLSAQGTGSVQGVITDTNVMSLPGSIVYIKSIDKGIDADFDWKFAIENIDEGTYNVLVSFVGFESVTKTVAVQNGKKTQLNISLKEASSVLDEVILTANKNHKKLLKYQQQLM